MRKLHANSKISQSTRERDPSARALEWARAALLVVGLAGAAGAINTHAGSTDRATVRVVRDVAPTCDLRISRHEAKNVAGALPFLFSLVSLVAFAGVLKRTYLLFVKEQRLLDNIRQGNASVVISELVDGTHLHVSYRSVVLALAAIESQETFKQMCSVLESAGFEFTPENCDKATSRSMVEMLLDIYETKEEIRYYPIPLEKQVCDQYCNGVVATEEARTDYVNAVKDLNALQKIRQTLENLSALGVSVSGSDVTELSEKYQSANIQDSPLRTAVDSLYSLAGVGR